MAHDRNGNVNVMAGNAEGSRKEDRRKLCFETETARDIQKHKVLNDIFIIEGIVTQGLDILAFQKKYGKPCLALDMALCVAGNEDFMGRKTNHCRVLYFALDDGMEQKTAGIMDGSAASGNITVVNDASSFGNTLEDGLDVFLDSNPDIKFVVIDPLEKILENRASGQMGYVQDYGRLSVLKKIVNQHDAALLAVTYTSGITGISGLLDGTFMEAEISDDADTVMSVFKNENQHGQEYTLFVIGRDMPETELPLSFNHVKCRWDYVTE